MPTILCLFGVTGDLSVHKLLPALYTLFEDNALPAHFKIIGFGRRDWSDDDFRKYVAEVLLKQKGECKPAFLEKLFYVSGNYTVPADYKKLQDKFIGLESTLKQKTNRLFYLAVPPVLYTDILTSIKNASLDKVGKGSWSRFLVEKPFGTDLVSAKKLNKLALKFFTEKQLFRVDHYLAKESVQAIRYFRKENQFLHSIWNNKSITKIEIQLFEEAIVGERGAFYDAVGALRDVGQNHLLQILVLIVMDAPKTESESAVRKARLKALSSLKAYKKGDIGKYAVRGQYEGYLSEPGVKNGSETETYFKVKAELTSSAWKTVPVYLESGKGLAVSKVTAKVFFKSAKKDEPNSITFLIQPGKGVEVSFEGEAIVTLPPQLSTKKIHGAYERIFLEAIAGDQTLFPHELEIEASWKFITPIVENWRETPLHIYKKKSI